MEKRTAEIIMVCKGHHDFGKELTHKQAIAAYIADSCCCPVEFYTDDILNDIIYQAALDYIDGLKIPSSFIRDIQNALNLHNNPLLHNINRIDYFEAVCIAFQLAQVRDSNKNAFVNGFSEELIQRVEKRSKN